MSLNVLNKKKRWTRSFSKILRKQNQSCNSLLKKTGHIRLEGSKIVCDALIAEW
jgi:hypothetical protein